MTKEQIEKAAKEAVQDYFQCNGKYPCKDRDYCEFCNGHNSAFDCNEDCGADNFNEGFIAGVEWRINSVWHDNSVRPSDDCDVLVETIRRIESDRYDADYNELDSGTDWETEVIRWAYIEDLLPDRKEVSI